MIVGLIGLAVAAAWVNWETGLQAIAVVNAVAAFWGNGILANFRGEHPDSVPNLPALVSIVTAFASVVLLVIGFVIR
jgi:hypothetical protein